MGLILFLYCQYGVNHIKSIIEIFYSDQSAPLLLVKAQSSRYIIPQYCHVNSIIKTTGRLFDCYQ